MLLMCFHKGSIFTACFSSINITYDMRVYDFLVVDVVDATASLSWNLFRSPSSEWWVREGDRAKIKEKKIDLHSIRSLSRQVNAQKDRWDMNDKWVYGVCVSVCASKTLNESSRIAIFFCLKIVSQKLY